MNLDLNPKQIFGFGLDFPKSNPWPPLLISNSSSFVLNSSSTTIDGPASSVGPALQKINTFP